MGSENASQQNNQNKQDLNINPNNQNSCDELGAPRLQPRRHRLYSDPQQLVPDSEKLQPIRRHINMNVTNLSSNLHNSIDSFPYKGKDSTLINSMKIERSGKRKLSQQYCSDFKKSYESQGNNNAFLNHLVEKLNQENFIQPIDFEKIREKYMPKYLYDWRYVNDPLTGVKSWENYGKIMIDYETFQKIKKLTDNPIGASQPFYLKRAWLFNYLIRRYGKPLNENPVILVNRNNIFEDSYNQFIKEKNLTLTKPLRIRFINEKVEDEEGNYREWYSCMFKDMISPKLRLFQINPYTCVEANTILFYPKYPGMKFEYYTFIGKFIVKAIVDLMIIRNMKLNRVLVKAISKRPITLDDIKYYNIDLFKKLKIINDSQIYGNPKLQQIRFIYNIKNENNMIQEIEMVPGGRNLFLNDSNKFSFIDKVIYNEAIKPYEKHIKAIQTGLHSIFEGILEGIFSVEELIFLLTGQDNIDINDWKENTIYKGCYNENHPVIKMFWAKINSLKKNEIFKFLEFSTGSGSIPIDGFGSLKGPGGKIQKFTIEPFTNYSADNPDEYKFQKIESKRVYHTIILPLYENMQELDKAMSIILSENKY